MDFHSRQFPPAARSRGLIVRQLQDETLIFDTESGQAHALTGLAARLWALCDGHTSLPDIVEHLGATDSEILAEDTAAAVLASLAERDLLQPRPMSRASMTRRDMVRTLALATLATPVIASVSVPIAAASSTCPGGACNAGCRLASDCAAAPNGCTTCGGTTLGTCPTQCCVPSGTKQTLGCGTCCAGVCSHGQFC